MVAHNLVDELVRDQPLEALVDLWYALGQRVTALIEAEQEAAASFFEGECTDSTPVLALTTLVRCSFGT